jgi:hypothetical protein
MTRWDGPHVVRMPPPPPEYKSPLPPLTGASPQAQLLVDRFRPRYDRAVAHARVFRAAPATCYQARTAHSRPVRQLH